MIMQVLRYILKFRYDEKVTGKQRHHMLDRFREIRYVYFKIKYVTQLYIYLYNKY